MGAAFVDLSALMSTADFASELRTVVELHTLTLALTLNLALALALALTLTLTSSTRAAGKTDHGDGARAARAKG